MKKIFFKKHQKGMTLVELMVAMIIFVIGMIGGLTYFFYGRGHISLSQHRRVALQLASQKIEDLKATTYINVICGSDNVTIDNMSYTRSWVVNPDPPVAGSYTEVTLSVSWDQGTTQQVQLVTIIADK